MPADPVWPDYFADPFVLAVPDGYVAYGTDPTRTDGAAFAVLVSADLRAWRSAEPVLAVDLSIGTDYWAPEVVHDGGAWWMLFSAGRGNEGHHLRVARAGSPLGPFVDQGVNLTPNERFAIDPHPFRDADGTRYLFYAHDVLDAEWPGTHLAVRRVREWTELDDEVHPVLTPNALWQRYEAGRTMYGRTLDWFTLEGPTVVRRADQYVLFYSGGSWEGPGYGVGTATAPTPLGPWTHEANHPTVLSAALTGQIGPGHNSIAAAPDGSAVIAYHAWDPARTVRRMHVAAVRWDGPRPLVDLCSDLGFSSA